MLETERRSVEWCAGLPSTEGWRPAQHCARLLLEARTPDLPERDNLYELARNGAFLDAEAASLPDDPELPLRVVMLALHAAVEAGATIEMAEFLMSFASRAAALSHEDPLQALRAGNLRRALHLAAYNRDSETINRHLLLSWELHDLGRRDEALEVLRAAVALPKSFQGRFSTILAAQVVPVDPDLAMMAVEKTGHPGEIQNPRYLAMDLAEAGEWSAVQRVLRDLAPEYRSLAWSDVVEKLLRGGRVDEALAHLDRIADPDWLAHIVSTAVDPQSPLVPPSRFLPLVATLQESPARDGILSSLALAFAREGDTEQAHGMADQIGQVPEKARALALVAAQAPPEASSPILAAAWRLAAMVTEPGDRVSVLAALCRAEGLSGHAESSARCFSEALDRLRELEPSQRLQPGALLAEDAHDGGLTGEAQRLLRDVVADLGDERLSDPFLLDAIEVLQSRLGYPQDARATARVNSVGHLDQWDGRYHVIQFGDERDHEDQPPPFETCAAARERFAAGDIVEALRIIEAVVARAHGTPSMGGVVLLATAGQVCLEHGHRERAEGLAEQALMTLERAAPQPGVQEMCAEMGAMMALALLLVDLGRHAEASALFEAPRFDGAAEMRPTFLEWLAERALKNGDGARARAILARALAPRKDDQEEILLSQAACRMTVPGLLLSALAEGEVLRSDSPVDECPSMDAPAPDPHDGWQFFGVPPPPQLPDDVRHLLALGDVARAQELTASAVHQASLIDTEDERTQLLDTLARAATEHRWFDVALQAIRLLPRESRTPLAAPGQWVRPTRCQSSALAEFLPMLALYGDPDEALRLLEQMRLDQSSLGTLRAFDVPTMDHYVGAARGVAVVLAYRKLYTQALALSDELTDDRAPVLVTIAILQAREGDALGGLQTLGLMDPLEPRWAVAAGEAFAEFGALRAFHRLLPFCARSPAAAQQMVRVLARVHPGSAPQILASCSPGPPD